MRFRQGALEILVLLQISQFLSFGKRVKILCFLDATFLGGSDFFSREVLAGVSLDAETPSSTKFSVKSSTHSGKSRNRSPSTSTVSLFLFMFWVSVGSRDWLSSGELLVLRRRVVAGLGEESSVVPR